MKEMEHRCQALDQTRSFQTFRPPRRPAPRLPLPTANVSSKTKMDTPKPFGPFAPGSTSVPAKTANCGASRMRELTRSQVLHIANIPKETEEVFYAGPSTTNIRSADMLPFPQLGTPDARLPGDRWLCSRWGERRRHDDRFKTWKAVASS